MTAFKRYLRLSGNEPAEVDDEIAYHIDMKTEQLRRAGYNAEQARAEALRQFGDRERIRSMVSELVEGRARRVRRAGLIDGARQDVRFAMRQLRSAPGFALVAILTVALGIGATTAVFSVMHATLLRPLPYDDADRIVLLGESDQLSSRNPEATTSFVNYEDWKARSTSFAAMAVYNGWSPALTGLGEARRLRGSLVTSELFEVFRIKPVLGRPMLPSDNVPTPPAVVWISWQLWQSGFAGADDVIGRTLTLGGNAWEIAGVLPREFTPANIEFGGDVWGNAYRDENDTRGSRYLNVAARLKQDVTLEQARAELLHISGQLQKEYPRENKGQYAVLFPLRELVIGGNTRGPLLVLMLAALVVLMIACANVSNLLIARGTYRTREFAIRTALGTTRSRIVRQLLTESAVLGGIGAVLGIGLAMVGLRILLRLAPATIQSQSVSIDISVLAFALASTLGAALMFGALPTWRTTRSNIQTTLRDETRGSTSARARRVRAGLAVTQLALALSLVLGAGLLIKSFARLLQIKPGIDPDNLIALSMGLPGAKYQGAAMPRFYEEIVSQAAVRPGVLAAAVTSIVPFSGEWDRIVVDTGVTRNLPGIDLPEGDRYIVSPSYFRTMRVPLLQGRAFEDADHADAPPVALVDEVFARKVQRNGTAIGARIQVPGRDSMATIVGIVGHVKHYGLDAESGGQIYVSHLQYPWRWMTLVVRAAHDPLALTPALRGIIRAVDAEQPITGIDTVESMMAQRTAARRFILALLGGFATIALTLACVGLYGVIAFTIAQRQREFGIRLALGASGSGLVHMVMREAVVLLGVGLASGIALALAATRLIGSLLFQVQPLDPMVLVGAAAVLGATAALAAWLPARRAAAADPLRSLHGN